MDIRSPKRQKVHQPVSYKPGFLKTVKVWNFTTYSFAEFNLSPTLNMIIGPNGSGKSTLVASICIGLAGNINLIKRKNLKSMIKTGHEKACIEIEIENFEDKPTIVIKREFTAKESNWFLNKRKTTEKEIKEVRKKFNIQLDNLCHFLPQERVAEFAGLSSEKLLLETERTLGDGHLLGLHEDLIEKDETSQELSRKIGETQVRLNGLIEEKEKLEEAAKRVEEYEKKSQQIENYKLLVPYARYNDLKKTRTALKKQREIAKNRLASFGKNYTQLKEDLEEIQNESNIETSDLRQKEQKLNLLKNDLKSHQKTKSKLEDTISELISKIKQYKAKGEEKKLELEKSQQNLKQLNDEKQSIEKVDEDEIEKLRKAYADKKKLLREIEDAMSQNDNQCRDKQKQVDGVRFKIRQEQSKLQSKDKLDILISNRGNQYRLRDESFSVHKRLRSRPEFKQNYYEAPILSCEVNDRNVAQVLEKIIDNNTLFSITVTRENQRFINEESKSGGWNIPIRTIDKIIAPEHELDHDRLKGYGFDGYLSDFITGPPEVLSMLYSVSKIDRIPFSRRALSSTEIQRVTEGNVSFSKFVSGDTIHSTTRSRYGQKNTVRRTEHISHSSQYFSFQGLSQDQKNIINQKIDEYSQQEQEMANELANVESKLRGMKMEHRKLREESERLKNRHHELKKLKDRVVDIESKIEFRKRRIEQLKQESNRDYSQKIQNSERKVVEEYRLISKSSVDLANVIKESSKIETDIKMKKFRILNLKNREMTCVSLMKELDQIQEKLKQDFKHYKSKYDEIKESREYKEVEKINSEHTQEQISLLSALAQEYIENDTFNENTVRKKVELLEDELSLLSTADKSSIDILRTKLQEIQRAETDLPIYRTEKERLDERIVSIKDQWETELDDLVNQISIAFNHRFTKVASDGRVELAKSDRFKDWKLQILVKFRENSELKILDNQSQSGGERAVSTIFFIMSLQGLTDAPFRIVDEINQGMDPKNEQMAHKYLVHTACQNSKSQYFLVTPKLLTGLYYHPDMVVHCIFTGPLIEPNKEGKKFLDFVDKS